MNIEIDNREPEIFSYVMNKGLGDAMTSDKQTHKENGNYNTKHKGTIKPGKQKQYKSGQMKSGKCKESLTRGEETMRKTTHKTSY